MRRAMLLILFVAGEFSNFVYGGIAGRSRQIVSLFCYQAVAHIVARMCRRVGVRASATSFSFRILRCSLNNIAYLPSANFIGILCVCVCARAIQRHTISNRRATQI